MGSVSEPFVTPAMRDEMYRLCESYGISLQDMTIILRIEFGIHGDSRTWDQPTYERALKGINQTGWSKAEFEARIAEARAEYQQLTAPRQEEAA